jgi:hypothetical protein
MRITYVPREDFELALDVRRTSVEPSPGVERVIQYESPDIVAGAHHALGQVRSNESLGARDEKSHFAELLHSSSTLALPLKPLDLKPESVVLLACTREKVPRQTRFGCNSLWGEQIEVGTLVRAVAKVLNFHESLANQGMQAIVRLPKTHPQLPRYFPLCQLWARVE